VNDQIAQAHARALAAAVAPPEAALEGALTP
jgi:hypothetical protein